MMVFEPGENGVGCAVRQEVKWSVRLKVDQDGSIAVATSYREVIESQDVHRGIVSFNEIPGAFVPNNLPILA